RRCARQLLRNPQLKGALDPILDIPGLRSGMRISTAHKLISLKCDEVRNAQIDPATVAAVELRCPRYSTEDSQFISSRLSRGEIFGKFDRIDRETIWERLRKITCVVPSLFTFFRD
ncbi:hypothetical protein BGZ63DRAFT_327518, partial [Mariannaea sp. PMI_226]